MDLLKKLRVQNTDGYESRDQLPEDELLALRDPQRRQNGVGGGAGVAGEGNDKDDNSHRSMAGTVLALMRSPGNLLCVCNPPSLGHRDNDPIAQMKGAGAWDWQSLSWAWRAWAGVLICFTPQRTSVTCAGLHGRS